MQVLTDTPGKHSPARDNLVLSLGKGLQAYGEAGRILSPCTHCGTSGTQDYPSVCVWLETHGWGPSLALLWLLQHMQMML